MQKLKKNFEPEIRSKAYNYKCGYCGKTFMREHNYVSHHCQEMKRHETLQTTLGQTAYTFYSYWHKTCRRLVPPPTTFLTSSTFVSFLTFSKFVKTIRMPNPRTYIRYMVEKKIQPNLWTNDSVYIMFLEYMDNDPDPSEHIINTVKTICEISEKVDIDVVDFFSTLTSNEVAQLIRQRRLSPWILLQSATFKKWFCGLDEEQQKHLETVIRPSFWKAKFENNPKGVKKVKDYITELGI